MQDRTEAPTPKRLQEARQRGQVARSTELTSVIGLLGLVLLAPFYLPGLYQGLTDAMQEQFRHLTRPDLTLETAVQFGREVEFTLVRLLWPLLVAAMVLGVAANVGQAGFLLTGRPVVPDFSRLNVFAGLARLFSLRVLVEMGKTLVKLAIVGGVAYQVVQVRIDELISLVGSDLWGSSALVLEASKDLVIKVGLAMGVLAVGDYLFQRWHLTRSLKMTRHEVREEYRQSEGDPVIRSQVRRRQRQIATQRMMAAVPRADVVVTNPTHLAVAMMYQPEKMRAPKVVAKGQWLMAERIKAVAQAAGVPVIENVPLARALYGAVAIGQDIPPALYQAVAEVLAFVYRLKGRKHGD